MNARERIPRFCFFYGPVDRVEYGRGVRVWRTEKAGKPGIQWC